MQAILEENGEFFFGGKHAHTGSLRGGRVEPSGVFTILLGVVRSVTYVFFTVISILRFCPVLKGRRVCRFGY